MHFLTSFSMSSNRFEPDRFTLIYSLSASQAYTTISTKIVRFLLFSRRFIDQDAWDIKIP